MIDRLRRILLDVIRPGEYFDLDGQSKTVTAYLREFYTQINPKAEPYVEFVFAWNAQEGDEVYFRPFCVRFRAPNFNVNSTPQATNTSFGSGAKQSGYQEIGLFLAGKVAETPEYSSMFGGLEHSMRLWTVAKFRSLAAKHAAEVNRPGVSKTMTSCVGTTNWAGVYPDYLHDRIANINQALGLLVKRQEHTSRDIMVNYDVSFGRMIETIRQMQIEDPGKLSDLLTELEELRNERRPEVATDLPLIEEETHWHPDEHVWETGLLVEWVAVRQYLEKHGVDVAACASMA